METTPNTPVDTAPNSPFDQLAQDVAGIKQAQASIQKRLDEFDVTILKILKLFKSGEEAFEVRVARVLSNTFKGLTDNLDHSIEDAAKGVAQLERGFDIYPVDGQTVLENEKTVLVAKTAEGGYNYSLARDPESIVNTGCEPFSKFFDDNPQLFGDRKELLVNIIAYTTMPKAMAEPERTDGEG